MDKFDGHIAGLGSTSGLRAVIGLWQHSPFGAFTDVMLQQADGKRILLAPNQSIANYVGDTYSFDEVVIADVHVQHTRSLLVVKADGLSLSVDVGKRTMLGRALGMIPARVATHTG